MTVNIIDAGLSFAENHADRDGAPRGIVLHHAAVDGSVEAIHRYHRETNGWAGIGYHFYVRKDGAIYRGRPEAWLGAHTSGYNDRLGVCAEGNFETESMGAAQREALTALLRELFARYGVLPVSGHRELDATACPGKNFPLSDIVAAAKRPDGGGASVPENLVLKFQKACLADGIVLPQYGADGVWGAETAAAAARLLQIGSSGERVKLAQGLVIGQGVPLPQYGADGVFGGETERGVKTVQTLHGLAADGVVGVQTWRVLLGV